MSLATYKKRSGTSDRGKDYEWLLSAFLALNLTTTSNVTDFELYANNEFFGDFDDITLRVKFLNGPTKVFLFQLKHSEKAKTLALNSLTSASGDFALLKYEKSYINILSLKNFYFILYVNKSANFKDKTTLNMEGRETFIRHHFCVGDNLLNTSKSRNCSIFRFETECNDFFDNFYLYVNQQNDSNLKQSISDLLKVMVCNDIYTTFVEFMRTWWTGNFKLTKTDVMAKLAELTLSPMIRTLSGEYSNEKTKLIKAAILKFDLTLTENSKIAKIWSEIEPNVKIFSQTALKYGLSTRGVGKVDDLSIEKRDKVFWFMDERPLLVEVDQTKKEQIDSIISLLGCCKIKKKIILWGYRFKGDFTNWSVLRDLSDISDCLRRTITETFTCTLQGKPTTLHELGAYDSKITSGFQVGHLVDLAAADNLNLGGSLETLPLTYIPRSFFKVLVSYSAIDGLKTSKILLSYNGQKDMVQTKFDKHPVNISTTDRRKNFFKYNIFVTDEEFTEDIVTKELMSTCPSHYFRVLDAQNLQWLTSNIQVEELYDYLRPNSSHIVTEDDLDRHFHAKIKILTSHTGTGKSSFLNRIKNLLPKNNYVVKMNLRNHSAFFRSYQDGTAWKYVVDFTCKKFDEFETELLHNFDKEKITILWDSLDEMDVNSIEGFITGVKELQTLGLTQWVAAQTRFEKFLEKKLGVFALSLRPFDENEQMTYIRNRCGVLNENILAQFFENIKILDNHEYLGVPLQLYILTEIFSKDPKLLETIYTVTDMFAAFVEGQYNHFLMREGNSFLGNLWGLIKDAKNYRFGQYKIAALKTFLPDFCQNLKNDADFVQDMMQSDYLGLIDRVDPGAGFIFTHQILGEYLCAVYLAENRPPGLEDFFFYDQYRNIRFMFDLLLAGEEKSCRAILYRKFDELDDHMVRDKGGRNPLHLICSYGSQHPPLWWKKTEKGFLIQTCDDNNRAIPVDSEIVKSTIKRLSLIYNPEEKDTLYQWTCFDYADHSFSLGLVEALPGEVLPQLYHYPTAVLLYYSIRMNYPRLFNTVKEISYVENTSCNNLIHVATEFGREDYLSKLLCLKPYFTSINKTNSDQWTALHIATFNGNLPLIKFLLQKGATFMLTEPSVMSLASAKGRKDLVEFFLDHGCSPNEFYHSNHFTTSIFQAIDQKHDTIVDLLLRNGAKLYCVNRETEDEPKPNPFGMNLFHMLLENEQFEEAQMVLKKGIHIDSIDNEGRTAFHHAAKTNQVSVVRFLLANRGNPLSLDNNNRSPLHQAASAGSIDVAKILIDIGGDLNLQDNEGSTPLHAAALAGKTGFVSFLLEKNVDPNIRNKYGRTPMHIAAMYDLARCIETLHLFGADLEARDLLYGRTPLHLAAMRGNEECVEVLLKKGAQLDSVCNFGFTALHLAMEEPCVESCKILLRLGASITVVNRNGHTPLAVMEAGYPTLNRLLLKYDTIPLHSAVLRGDAEFINELLEAEFDVNCTDAGGNTPLHMASENREPTPLVSLLLKKGADVKIRNGGGYTPLLLAIQNDYCKEDTVKLLVQADQKGINIATLKEMTPLHAAVQRGWQTVVRLLLDKGAECKRDDVGLNPLHYACASGNLDLAALLTKHSGVNVNETTYTGRTPLHLASSRGHLSVVKFLLKHNAAVQVVDEYGDSPLHDALRGEHPEIFKLLLTYNPDFEVATTYLGRTILHGAAKQGLLPLVKHFIQEGIPADTSDIDDSTPFEEALHGHHSDVIDFLFTQNFDVNKYSKRYCKYPLHALTCGGLYKWVDLFLQLGAKVGVLDDEGNTPLHNAVERDQPKIFQLLLKHGHEAIDIQNGRGQTVLHLAVELRKPEILRSLIDNDANLDLLDNTGNTAFDIVFHEGCLVTLNFLSKMKTLDVDKPSRFGKQTLLHMAVESESIETIKWLISKGASIASEDMNGNTPLHYAANSNPEILDLLLNKYPFLDLEKTNYEGETVLHLAAQTSLASVEKLLKLGASPYASTKYAVTPLFYALKNPPCFKTLWQKTPDIEIFNLTGQMARTPLHAVASKGDVDIVKFFLEVGLKINEVDNKGNTALSDAAREGHTEVVELLLQQDKEHTIINMCDKQGMSLLHLAACWGRMDLIHLLVRNKAKLDLYDKSGRTAADYAFEGKHMEIYKFLKHCQTR